MKIKIKLILKAIKNIHDLPKIKQPKISPTIRAKNINKEDHQTIINWEEFNIEKIWHILRGTEMWLDTIQIPNNIFPFHTRIRFFLKDT
ncbi:MAG: hypothetical protein CMP21_00895 [Rickettsiales bacterium]|nr:hypothetical protein [Rickettsiales bacterium]|tara:strand:- start:6836 stop:7102 length:267 start_codon:yes stop_codon:yes gene_type:complete